MNYTKINEEENKIKKKLLELEKQSGKTDEQTEYYKKYLFYKNLKEKIIKMSKIENDYKEIFNFNYKKGKNK